jgi:hypothetical protein
MVKLMNARKSAFVPGDSLRKESPLERFMPVVPPGMLPELLAGTVGKRGVLLDPFGSSPTGMLDVARQGYQIVMASNNPILTHTLRVLAGGYPKDRFHRILANLAATRKGDERLEKHLEELYGVQCPECGTQGQARAFIWVKGASSPESAILDCLVCKRRIEMSVNIESQKKLAGLSKGGMHRAMAYEKIAALNDPIRPRVEQALENYLTRPLYVLFTLLNRLESLQLNVEDESLVHGLLISAFDAGNTLWSQPSLNLRPKQLGQAGHIRENNLWLAINEAVEEWSEQGNGVPIVDFPQMPPASGGISLFPRRFKELLQQLDRSVSPDGVLAVLPRPNQAFWTLSAVWAGWLWGSQAVQPFRSALIRQRYDWQWYADALTSITSLLYENVQKPIPVIGLLTEYEPPFLLSTLAAFDLGGFSLKGYSLNLEMNTAQLVWERQDGKPKLSGELRPVIRKALVNQLKEHNQPVEYSLLAAAAGFSLAEEHLYQSQAGEPSDRYTTAYNTLKTELMTAGDYIRFRGQRTLESEIWWRNGLKVNEHSGDDRIEFAIIGMLLQNSGTSFLDIQKRLNEQFPGLLTPGSELIRTILDSYGEIVDPVSGIWKLATRENPLTRQTDLSQIFDTLKATGIKFGYKVEGETDSVWKDADGNLVYYFIPTVHACISGIMINSTFPPEKCIIAIPASRANLLLYKIEHNPLMYGAMAAGWRVVKFRHIRHISMEHQDEPEQWEMQLDMDPLEFKPIQMKMF